MFAQSYIVSSNSSYLITSHLSADNYMVSNIPIKYKKNSKMSIWSIDGTLTVITAPGKSGAGGNGTECHWIRYSSFPWAPELEFHHRIQDVPFFVGLTILRTQSTYFKPDDRDLWYLNMYVRMICRASNNIDSHSFGSFLLVCLAYMAYQTL